jgi:hypothetical protein
MATNETLTALLAGKTVGPSTGDERDWTVLNLTDGTKVRIHTASMVGTAGITGGRIASVAQEGTRLTVVFANGHRVDFATVEPTGCVQVLDPAGGVVYEG